MSVDYEELVEIIRWIDQHATGVELPNDERSLLASGCFDIALEHQAAIAILYSSELYGSMMALRKSNI